jgi:hypothetical protein
LHYGFNSPELIQYFDSFFAKDAEKLIDLDMIASPLPIEIGEACVYYALRITGNFGYFTTSFEMING